ncbi:MAG TPA: hypothetical protein VJT71_02270 [Pyrinomonadaceae bacterium]|nr:hypothetical protein [Pyrinomonadaceae bacterium]
MKPALHKLSLPGAMLARGFWLYVWEVTDVKGKKWLYVGRTGDSSSPNAQSPFARLSQHLSQNPSSNALRRNLMNAGVDADTCAAFELHYYGPILAECSTMELHGPARDTIAGLEKGLRDALHTAGYPVLNEVKSRHEVDEELMTGVLNAFAGKFEKLAKGNYRSVGA